MHSILSDRFGDLKNYFVEKGLPASRAYQVFGWIYRKFNFSFDSMSDLPKKLREELPLDCSILELTQKDVIVSPEGETVKFLFETADRQFVESVIIIADEESVEPGDSRVTLCISSQAGCPLGCKFCATGMIGFKRNLTAGEIVSQVLLCESYLRTNKESVKDGRIISNIVFMGMGEPFLNYEAALQSVEILSFSGGYHLGGRHFTFSTAGIIPGIERLTLEKIQIRLAVSLHSAFQNVREELMPIAKTYPLPDLISALKAYQEKTGRRITMEYILLKRINGRPDDAKAVAVLLSGLDYNLNLIVYNPVEGLPFERPEEREVRAFEKELISARVPYVIRRSKGRGINAGCGQLGLFWRDKLLNGA